MKILFDNQIYTHQKYGGISRYYSELIKEFTKSCNKYKLPIFYSKNEYLKSLNLKYQNFQLKNNINNKYLKKLIIFLLNIFIYFGIKINKYLNIKELKKQKFDIFHPTYFNPYFLKYLKNKKFVLTIYDLNYEIFPQYFKEDKGKIAKRIKYLAKKANKIIAISKNTKNDIIKYYNIPENKIDVVYLDSSLNVNHEEVPNLPKKFILFVGNRGTYKNFNFFVESIARLLQNNNLYLIASGGGAFNLSELDLFKKLNIENKVNQISATDGQLATLYSKAHFFVFPSLSEGFGLPILEAFSCKCPVICSNTTSLPEVAGDAALYFNPEDKNDIFNKVNSLIDNNILRDELIYKGEKQLKNFSWEKTTKETIKVYESILN